MENPAVSDNNPANPDNWRPSKPLRPKRVRMFKDDVVAENTTLKARVKALENWISNFKELPTHKRIKLAFNLDKETTP